MKRTTLGRALAACTVTIPFALAAGPPIVHAENGDTHVSGQSLEQTVDCNGVTLMVDGTSNTVNALGTCWAVTMMSSGNTVIADAVIHDITVYGWDEAVYYKSGQPFVWDQAWSTASIM